MFILYGTRVLKSFLVKNINRKCTVCENLEFSIIKYRNWFTLFFIPVIPISRLKYFVMCNECKNGHEIEKDMVYQYIER